jgi:dipeptidase E
VTAALLLSLGAGAVPGFLRAHGAGSRAFTIGYLPDAARAYPDAPFAVEERDRVRALGHPVVEVVLTGSTRAEVAAALDRVDVLWVAGGSTFALLDAVRGADAAQEIAGRVRDGLLYIGSSAGSILAGPSVEPASVMDDPADAPEQTDLTGLGLVDVVVVPHADGALPPYPPEVIARTVAQYGDAHRLVLLRDDQALLVEGTESLVVASA